MFCKFLFRKSPLPNQFFKGKILDGDYIRGRKGGPLLIGLKAIGDM